MKTPYDQVMRVTYDATVDMAYVYLREIEAGGVATTVPGWPDSAAFGVNLDFDPEGRLVGIEIDGATALLPPEVIAKAKRL